MKKIILFFMLLWINAASFGQTFDCYVANDSFVSTNVYQFDVYIKATTSDFYFRSIQLAFIFNPSFVQQGAVVTATAVNGTSGLHNYSFSNSVWNAASSVLNLPSSPPGGCNGTPNAVDNDYLTVNNEVRVSTFRLTSDLPFNCVTPDISMLRPNDPPPPGVFRCAISCWTNVCTASSISALGHYTYRDSMLLYSQVNNPFDTNCTTGISEMEHEVSVYPNPSNGIVFIEGLGQIKKVELFDLLGNLQLATKLSGNDEKVRLDMSNLAPGFYILKIDDRWKRRILIQAMDR
jgi:hypothetical protein